MLTNKDIDKLDNLIKLYPNIDNIYAILKYLIVVSLFPISEDNELLKSFFCEKDNSKKIFYLYKLISEIQPDIIYKIYKTSINKLPRIYENEEKDIVLLCLNTQGGFGDYVSTFKYFLELTKNVKKVLYPIPWEVKSLFEYNLQKYSINNVELLTENLEDIIIEENYDYIRKIHPIYYEDNFKNITPDNSLFVKAEDVETFKRKFVNPKTFNIGISWKSDRGNYPLGRNTDFSKFLEMTNIKNAQVYSLQYGISDEELNNENVINLGKYFNNIYETAVGVKSMDIIVSIDNLIMNLGQSLGVKTFLLIPFKYLWCSEKTRNYRGYRNLKIFQNNETNNYEETVLKIINEIKILISSLQK